MAEHLRRIAHISRLLNEQGIITICSFISPDDSVRKQVAQIVGEDKFQLVHLDASVEYCWNNDGYGLYKKADIVELKYLPRINMEFEAPEKPDLVIDLKNEGENIEILIDYLSVNKIYPAQ